MSSSPYEASDVFRFATDDPPQRVIEVMEEVAAGLPELAPGTSADGASPMDKARYEINIPLTSPGKQYGTLGAVPHPALVRRTPRRAAPRPRPDRQLRDAGAGAREPAAAGAAVPDHAARRPRRSSSQVRLERYGEGEVVQRAGVVPDGVRVIIDGVVELQVPASQGAIVPVLQLQARRAARPDRADPPGGRRRSARRSPTSPCCTSRSRSSTRWSKTRPALARDIGSAIDHRQDMGDEGARRLRRAAAARRAGDRVTRTRDRVTAFGLTRVVLRVVIERVLAALTRASYRVSAAHAATARRPEAVIAAPRR